MVCCFISHILLFDMGMHECLEKYWHEQSESENMNATFPFLGVQILLHYNLVLYEVGGCSGSSSHVHA
jgi:hypothetical protein